MQLLALGHLSFEACYPAFLLQNGLQAQPELSLSGLSQLYARNAFHSGAASWALVTLPLTPAIQHLAPG